MRFFVWLAGGFLVIVLIVLLILGITRTDTTVKQEAVKPLSSFADSNLTVSYVTSGRIVAPVNHREIIITVTKSSATLQIVQGYEGQVISTNSFANDTASYTSFLAAIDTAGFTKSREPAGSKDIAGQCPLGNRYIYSARGVSEINSELWSTTCGSRDGTFAGNANTIRQLFQAQIPNYSQLVSNVRL